MILVLKNTIEVLSEWAKQISTVCILELSGNETNNGELFKSNKHKEKERIAKITYFIFIIYLLAALCGLWDLSSPTRGPTCGPCSGNVGS